MAAISEGGEKSDVAAGGPDGGCGGCDDGEVDMIHSILLTTCTMICTLLLFYSSKCVASALA